MAIAALQCDAHAIQSSREGADLVFLRNIQARREVSAGHGLSKGNGFGERTGDGPRDAEGDGDAQQNGRGKTNDQHEVCSQNPRDRDAGNRSGVLESIIRGLRGRIQHCLRVRSHGGGHSGHLLHACKHIIAEGGEVLRRVGKLLQGVLVLSVSGLREGGKLILEGREGIDSFLKDGGVVGRKRPADRYQHGVHHRE